MGHVCPWWFAYTFDNPLRNLFHDPGRILAPYVREGMRVADIGCGLGYFSLGLARIVTKSGRVFAVDIQPQMLQRLSRRTERAGLSATITPLLCRNETIEIPEPLDFVLAFWMVHEVPDAENLFRQIHAALKPSGIMLFTEPVFHVRREHFLQELAAARKAGFMLNDEPDIRWSYAAVLTKSTCNTPSA